MRRARRVKAVAEVEGAAEALAEEDGVATAVAVADVAVEAPAAVEAEAAINLAPRPLAPALDLKASGRDDVSFSAGLIRRPN